MFQPQAKEENIQKRDVSVKAEVLHPEEPSRWVRLQACLLGRSALGTSCQEAAPGQAQETPEKVLRANMTVLTEGLEEVMEVWVSLLQLLQLQPDLDGKKMNEGVNDSQA